MKTSRNSLRSTASLALRAGLFGAAVVAIIVPSAQARWTVANGLLEGVVSAGATWDSDVLLDETGQDDIYFLVEPGLRYTRNRGRATLDSEINYGFRRYLEFNDENSEDLDASLHFGLPTSPGARVSGSIDGRYFKGMRTDSFYHTRLESNSLDFGANGAFSMTQRTNLRAGVHRTTSDLGAVGDAIDTSWSFGAGYTLSPRINTFVDVTLQDSESTASITTTDLSSRNTGYTAGITGQLSTKISGTISAGVNKIAYDSGIQSASDRDTFLANVSLEWSPRERTGVTLSAASNTVATPLGADADSVTYQLAVSQEIGTRMASHASLAWHDTDFAGGSGRSDQSTIFELGAEYTANANLSFTGTFTHTKHDSTVREANYKQSGLTVSAVFTF